MNELLHLTAKIDDLLKGRRDLVAIDTYCDDYGSSCSGRFEVRPLQITFIGPGTEHRVGGVDARLEVFDELFFRFRPAEIFRGFVISNERRIARKDFEILVAKESVTSDFETEGLLDRESGRLREREEVEARHRDLTRLGFGVDRKSISKPWLED